MTPVLVLVAAALLFVPSVVVAVWVKERFGAGDDVVFPLALLVLGAAGYVAFWTYYLSDRAGRVLSVLFLCAGAVAVVAVAVRPVVRARAGTVRVALPLILLCAVGCLYTI